MNKIFVIEGTDGSGKQTQTEKLYSRLLSEGLSSFKTSFPNYENLSSGPVREYLSGNISRNPNDISAKAASTFYAVDRYISYKENIQKYYEDDSTIIIFDRYVSSNLLHQGGKVLGQSGSYDKLSEFADWNYNLEHHDLELPVPTAIFFLYIPIESTLSLMKDRVNKITHESKKDIHETDINHLTNASNSGYYLAKKLGWYIVECVRNGKLREIDDIHNEIYEIVKNNL
ncbi:MAG: putative thymidylate kinase [Clostridia bacterium]|jgi:dTMP kinase|nr:putative thymidylate kinase [Clostridia bacterium]